MPQLLTPNINWDISSNNVDVSGNMTASNVLAILSNTRTDVSYNFSVVGLAGNTFTRSIYFPNPYNGQYCLVLNSGTPANPANFCFSSNGKGRSLVSSVAAT